MLPCGTPERTGRVVEHILSISVYSSADDLTSSF